MSDKRNNTEKREMLDAASLREHLDYDPDTGIFIWKERRWRRAKGVAGCVNNKGYIVITINDKQYYAQQLAWLYQNGVWPSQDIDHKDTNRKNNRILNLREVNQTQNNANMRCPPRNKSGYKGVRLRKSGRYEAAIGATINGKRITFYVGIFDDPNEASEAYLRKAAEVFGKEFARVG
jgi:hypothetical protein